MFEVVHAFLRFEEVADITDRPPQSVIGSHGSFSQMGLQLGKGHLDRIEIRRILRQEQEPGAYFAQHLCGNSAFVNRQVVQNDDAAVERWGELGFDIDVEGIAVDGAVEHPRCGQPPAPQAGDECLGFPVPEGRRCFQAFAAWRPPAQSRQLGRDRGFVEEDKTMRLKPHARLAQRDPHAAFLTDVRPCAFRGNQLFFYMLSLPCTAASTVKLDAL